MFNKYKLVFIIFLLFLCSSCYNISNKNKFIDFKSHTYNISNKLRSDGYYYFEYVYKTYNCGYPEKINIILLYKDGIVSVNFGGYCLESDHITKDELAKELSFTDDPFELCHKAFDLTVKNSWDTKKEIDSWGSYYFKEDTIKIAYFELSESGNIGAIPYHLEETYGIIKNDSTFIMPDGLTGRKNEVYKFRQYSPKPDSLNLTIRSRIFKSKKWPGIYIPFLDFN